MRIYLPAILFLFLFLSPEDSWAEKNYRVVVFGDSIISGFQLQPQESFPAKLEQRLRASGYDHLEVINLSKDNLSSANAIAQTDLVAQKLPDVIILQLGFNDTARGVLASAIHYNLNTIIYELKKPAPILSLLVHLHQTAGKKVMTARSKQIFIISPLQITFRFILPHLKALSTIRSSPWLMENTQMLRVWK